MTKRLKLIILGAIGILAAAALAAAALPFWPKTIAGENRSFTIEAGRSTRQVAEELKAQGSISSPAVFVIYAKLINREGNFRSGRYQLSTRESVFSLANKFSSNQAEHNDVVVVVPEGTNIADLGRILAKAGLIQTENEILKPEFLELEGRLFPDTYRIKPGAELDEMLEKMKDNFEVKTARLFDGLSSREKEETVIVASMLEKEVVTDEDRRLVAGIMAKRLKIGMPLQIDATVSYGICWEQFQLGRYCDVALANIVDNLSKDSVYNTYVNNGLPPAPIANPGTSTIKAVLNPLTSDFLYYLSKPDGATVFSKTAREHQLARQKFLQ